MTIASLQSRVDAQIDCVDADFRPHYMKHVFPKVQEYEILRTKAIRSFRFRTLVAIPSAFIGIAFLFYLMALYPSELMVNIAFIVGLAGGGSLFYWAYNPIKNYKASVRGEIYPLIFSFFGPTFAFRHQSPITVQSFKSSDIIPGYDDETTGDYVRGEYRGVNIEILEAEMTETRGTGKSRRKVRIFKGVLVSLSAHKRFDGKTIIKRDMGALLNWTQGFTHLSKVSLEDPLFEKKFEVFSSNQVEARYLLTTSFMDRMLKLKELFQSNTLEASFYDSRLLLTIATNKNYFENSSIYKPVTFIDEAAEILAQMRTFFEIIETLKLDENTGL